jgi:hypothetical protein
VLKGGPYGSGAVGIAHGGHGRMGRLDSGQIRGNDPPNRVNLHVETPEDSSMSSSARRLRIPDVR